MSAESHGLNLMYHEDAPTRTKVTIELMRSQVNFVVRRYIYSGEQECHGQSVRA